nr:LytTR family DNA-binding domain-containing protein [Liquorilactobacillus hordei]
MVNAHTKNDLFETHLRLYELEKLLPQNFMRVSKSTIINLDAVYTLTRSLTGNLIAFHESYKQVYVSRRYVKDTKRRLESREE